MRIERIGERDARYRGADVARELGIGLRTDQAPATYEAIARRAEGAGVDVLSVFHDLLYQPAIGPLLLMARVTERIRLGPAALNPFTLHPYEIAGQIAMLDSVSAGRAYLGLAKGAWLDRLGIDEDRPLAALREAVAVIEALLAGDTAGVDGERFTLAPGTALAYPRERDSVPLLIGTWGPRDGALGRHGRGRGEDRRHREPRSAAASFATGSTTLPCGSSSAASPSWTRTATGRAAHASAVVQPYIDVVARHDPTLEPRSASHASSASASQARPTRWPRASASSGMRAPTASSSEPRRAALHSSASS